MSKVRKRKLVRWKRMSVFDIQPSFSTSFLDHKIYIHGKSEYFSSTILKLLFPKLCHIFHLSNYEFHLHLLWINMLITLVSMCVTELMSEKENASFNPPYFLYVEYLRNFLNWNRILMEVLVNVQRPEVRSENLFHGYLYTIIIYIFLSI